MRMATHFSGSATGVGARADTVWAHHQCLCYETPEELVQAVIPFVTQGFAAGEQCLYIAEDRAHSPVLQNIRAARATAGARVGALAVFSPEETYLRDPPFEPERMLDWIRQRVGTAIAAGFSSVRLVGEINGIPAAHPGAHRVAEYEAKLNTLTLPDGISVLCTYDVTRFPKRTVLDGVETHPSILIEGTLCENPHFVPPDLRLRPDWSVSELRWLLRSLRRLQQAHDEQREREQQRERLWLRLLERQEAERRAFARDLHDDLGQILTAVHLRLQAEPTELLPNVLPEADALLSEAMKSARQLSFDLRPPVLDDLGLAAAVRSQARRQAQYGGFQVQVEVTAIEGGSFSPSVETACFRVMVAALTNVVRHAAATHVQVQIEHDHGCLKLVVHDDGKGFDVEAARARAVSGATLGLLSMEERTSLAGGNLVVDSIMGRGTSVEARFPIQPPPAAPPPFQGEGGP